MHVTKTFRMHAKLPDWFIIKCSIGLNCSIDVGMENTIVGKLHSLRNIEGPGKDVNHAGSNATLLVHFIDCNISQ